MLGVTFVGLWAVVPGCKGSSAFLHCHLPAVVNDDGSAGTAPRPLVCSAGGLPKRHRVVHAVRDAACCLGLHLFGNLVG